MHLLNTVGDVVTCLLALAAVVFVPAGIIRAWFPEIRARIGAILMSRQATAMIAEIPDKSVVSIPVPIPPADTGIDWQMPRISAYLSDQEFIIFLARQKRKDGKDRLSANKIVDIVELNRNEVLDLVRQVRATPEYRDLPEQQSPHPA